MRTRVLVVFLALMFVLTNFQTLARRDLGQKIYCNIFNELGNSIFGLYKIETCSIATDVKSVLSS